MLKGTDTEHLEPVAEDEDEDEAIPKTPSLKLRLGPPPAKRTVDP